MVWGQARYLQMGMGPTSGRRNAFTPAATP